ncbi:MAG TPA: TetR/AcrR family transcriptional regulator [Candidatus Solibacter sp.]|jgi:AcrR family transcriptional regulator|nr:TetR/AcrR family transcriptional regulator [Candidatus Solibacter sp.]
MKEPKAVPVKESKAAAQILEAAIELFADYGYFGTTIRDVAKKADVTAMTIYRLYKSKDGLFEVTLNTVIKRSLDQAHFLLAVFNSKDKRDSQALITTAVRQWYDSLPQQPARLMMYAYLSQEEKWRELAYARLEEIVAVLAGTLDEAIDKKAKPRPKTAVAARTLVMALFQFKITQPKIKSAREERAAIEDILNQWLLGVAHSI